MEKQNVLQLASLNATILLFRKTKQEELGVPNLQIISLQDVKSCSDIKDTSLCKYSDKDPEDDGLCCLWSVPANTTSSKDFSVLKNGATKNSNKEQCQKMSQTDNQQKSSYAENIKKQYGLSNKVTITCESGGTNGIIDAEEDEKSEDDSPYYTKSAQNLKISFFIILALIYCLV